MKMISGSLIFRVFLLFTVSVVSADEILRSFLMQETGPDSRVVRNSAEWFFADGNLRTESGNYLRSYQLMAGNVPVFGERLLLFLNEEQQLIDHALNVINNGMLGNLDDFSRRNQKPVISFEEAQKVAARDLRLAGVFPGGYALPDSYRGSGTLYWYRCRDEYRLVWYFALPGRQNTLPVLFEYFIDAESGEIFNRTGNMQSGSAQGYRLSDQNLHQFAAVENTDSFVMIDRERQLEIFSRNLETPCTDEDGLWDYEGEKRSENQKAEVELYLNMVRVVDFFRERFDFRWNGGKTPVQAIAHVLNNFNNAYYLPATGAFYFGDGSGKGAGFDYLPKALDVAAHEYGHGIMAQLSPLTYSDEPGTLNEHIADVMGSLVDDKDWTIGESLVFEDYKPPRNMADPTWGHEDLLEWGMTFQEWEIMNRKHGLKLVVYPHRLGRKIICTSWYQDEGGVHINAPIFNRFFYLAATGDGLNMKGLGRHRLGEIYMKLLKEKWLDKNSSFDAFKKRFTACATEFLRHDPDKAAFLTVIESSFAKIEL
jgi:Zn-dependent metalloprotease